LTRDAVRLSGYVAARCDWRWCPAGGLEVLKPDGLAWCLSPVTVARLRVAGLLPDALVNTKV
jgi:hypothetical protein